MTGSAGVGREATITPTHWPETRGPHPSQPARGTQFPAVRPNRKLREEMTMVTNFASVIFRAMPLDNAPISASSFPIVDEWQDIWELQISNSVEEGGGSYAALSRISHQNVSPPPRRTAYTKAKAVRTRRQTHGGWVTLTAWHATPLFLPPSFPPPFVQRTEGGGLDCVKKQRAARTATRPPPARLVE